MNLQDIHEIFKVSEQWNDRKRQVTSGKLRINCNLIYFQMPVPKAKQKNRAGDIGAQGAYFQPTVSRLLAKSSIEKSCTVENHVPSLLPQTGMG